MKPSVFDYVRATSKQEVLDLLATEAQDTKILAGGQSLVPMMNFRLARPSRLVDINALPDMAGVTPLDDRIHVGALTRHRVLEQLTGEDPLSRLLRAGARHVGHLPIRTRGTFGGSLAHSDASSEWCLIARLLDAEMIVESVRGRRAIPASDFFLSIFTTAMEDDELLVGVSLPALGDDHHTGFAEFARRAGDFAIVGVATDLDVLDGQVKGARICIGGVSDTPFRSTAAEELLMGQAWDPGEANDAVVLDASEAAAAEVSPPTDGHGDGEYRRDLVRTLLARALQKGVAG